MVMDGPSHACLLLATCLMALIVGMLLVAFALAGRSERLPVARAAAQVCNALTCFVCVFVLLRHRPELCRFY